MTVNASSCPVGSSVTLTGGFFNASSTNFAGQFAIKVEGTNGSVQYIQIANTSNLQPNYGWNQRTLTVPSTIAQGHYTLTPVFRVSGGEWQPMLVDRSLPTYLSMNVIGTTAHFAPAPTPTIEVTEYTPESEFFIDTQFRINVTVENTGLDEYGGYVFGVLMSADGTTQIGSAGRYPIYLSDGESTTFPYISTFEALSGQTITAGTYTLVFADYAGKIISEPTQITINNKPAGEITIANLAVVGDANAAERHDLRFTADVTCTSGYYAGQIDLYIFPYIPGQSVSSEAHTRSEMLFIPAGETQKANFSLDFANATLGNTYFTQLYNNGTRIPNTQTIFTIASTDGVDGISTDSADVVATEVYSLQGIRVADSTDNLTPGVYILRELRADGSSATRRVLIK